ncbi:DNA polymerase IV [Piscinibacter sp. HJYY11]|uniref:DNA polymerase IV n=1 Tax=Piscinibacter sp. HJYY11 TaxID=2801333 RepID=UPI00191EFE1A|nr:DNA polymerase IV [Piscinibacter sp. HJYY11]MBL0730460.1 DNA polymerase IV [Piscinibacter sp. HJYY11]
MPRLIAHLDMDAFYASVELLRYPELKGLPVVIGGGRRHQPVLKPDGTREFSLLRDYTGRGVLTTSTYEARKLGVFSAMPTMKAAKLAPDAVLLPVDFDEYRKYSRLFKAAVRRIAPLVEDRGIDEIYIDLTDLPGVHDDGGRAIGQQLKDAVREATGGLTCSVGITPNKLLSKLCSEFDKPDGLTLLTHDDIPARIWPLAARKLNGIGPKSSEKLAALGLHTLGDIAAADPLFLVERFGRSYGAWLHAATHGRDDRPVVTHSEPVSMSRETTFERDLHAVRDRHVLTPIFTDLCVELADDLSRKGYAAKTIGIKLRFDDFKIVTRDLTLPAHTMDAKTIRRAAGECLKRADLTRRLRLLGVRAGNLAKLTELLNPHATEAPVAQEPVPAYHAPLPLFDASFDASDDASAA